jgi:hypothetical protein
MQNGMRRDIDNMSTTIFLLENSRTSGRKKSMFVLLLFKLFYIAKDYGDKMIDIHTIEIFALTVANLTCKRS